MPNLHPLTSEPRKITGRQVKKLRAQGLLPANIFGSKVKSQAIQVDQKDFLKTYQQVGDTGLIELTVKGEKTPRPALVHLIQTHPVTDMPLHVDFRQVDLKEKITADVPIELVGESPAVEQKGGILVQVMDEIEVEALPTDLPEKYELDISKLVEIEDSLLVSDLKVDTKKVTLQAEPEATVAKVEAPQEEEEEAPAPSPEEVEATEEKGEEEPKEAESEEKGEAKEETSEEKSE